MTEITHLGDLTPDLKNARRHNARNIGMIEKSLGEVGAARSIVIDETGRVLAGNGTIDAAAAVGIERVRVIDADGDEIIAVRRSGLTEEQKIKLALYDNRSAELADWEPGVLAEIAQEIDVGPLWTPEEWREAAMSEDDEDAGPVDPNELWRGMPEFEQEALQDKYKSLIVHFETPEDYAAFAQLIGQALTERSNFIWYPYKPTHGVAGSMQGYVVDRES